jgi:hypothetical protein
MRRQTFTSITYQAFLSLEPKRTEKQKNGVYQKKALRALALALNFQEQKEHSFFSRKKTNESL